MKCLQCNIEMDEGISTGMLWLKGSRNNLSWWTRPFKPFMFRSSEWVSAWRCPNCRKIEFYSTE